MLLSAAGLVWIAPLVGIIGLIAGFLLLVAAYENGAGTYLPLAVLFVIVLLVLFLLILAMAYIHAMFTGAR
ncbi:hypothetical protein [Caenibius sp. WL]|uniref:hypothetical protein n=1 Tax=Caenibius sp. WL TaxID=2872646 RepID=UPI001C996B11|nr:hypothetical protein [Caenibius sp. WL]QZP09122.1 hypothetical protein K5X80_04950 [Caenibius sp. WL]